MTEIIKHLMSLTLFSSAVMLAVLLLRSIFENKLNTKVLSMLWIICLVRLIVPFNISSPVHFNELFMWQETVEILNTDTDKNEVRVITNQKTSDDAIKNSDTAGFQIENPNNIAINQTQDNFIVNQSSFQEAKAKIKFSIYEILAVIWILGMITSLVINIIKMASFNKRISLSKIIYNRQVFKMMIGAKKKLLINKRVLIYECDYIDAPVTVGVIRPKIILPTGFISSIENHKLELIFLHELCHIKSFDVFKNYLWMISSIFYWFNPLVYITFKAYLDDIEFVADEMVLKTVKTDQRIQYSQSLIDAIKLSRADKTQSKIALSFCTSKTKLRKRVENMINPQRKRKMATFVSIMICVVLAITCFTTACLPSVEAKDSEKQDDNKAIVAKSKPDSDPIDDEADMMEITAEIKTINEVIESEKYILNIDADVADYGDREFNVYNAKPIDVDVDAWKNYFFSDLDQSKINKFNEILYWGVELKDEDIALLEDSFGYVNKSNGKEFTYEYMPITSRLTIYRSYFEMIDEEISVIDSETNEYKETAQLAGDILSFVTDNEFSINNITTRNLKGGDILYRVNFDRTIDDFDVLCDNPLFPDYSKDGFVEPIKGDRLTIGIVNNELCTLTGYIRDIEKSYSSKIMSAEKVIEAFTHNVDEIDAFNQNGNPQDDEKAHFNISSVELKYYPVLHEDESLHNTYRGVAGYATYKPAYVVSSGSRLESRFHYVMIIDAITGEVLNKDELGDNHIYDIVPPPTVSDDSGGYNVIAPLTGDFIDYEIEYVNKETGESVNYIVDNQFCWLLNTQEWMNAGALDEYTPEDDLTEWVDIRGCKVTRIDDTIYLYHKDYVFEVHTDASVFDKIVKRIKDKR